MSDDKPNPVPPCQPLQLPANFRDVTAEKIGTVIGIIGATAAGKGTKPGSTPHRPPQDSRGGGAGRTLLRMKRRAICRTGSGKLQGVKAVHVS